VQTTAVATDLPHPLHGWPSELFRQIASHLISINHPQFASFDAAMALIHLHMVRRSLFDACQLYPFCDQVVDFAMTTYVVCNRSEVTIAVALDALGGDGLEVELVDSESATIYVRSCGR
jgi:hypothetical protein